MISFFFAITSMVVSAITHFAIFALTTAIRTAMVVIPLVIQAIGAVISTVVGAVKWAVDKYTRWSGNAADHPAWYFIIFRHFDWKRALLGQEEHDEEVDRITSELEDSDANGIPDLYDLEVRTPEADFLGIKYPVAFLEENDYIRLMPRRLGALSSPVPPGSKGIVRDVWIDGTGAYARIKWNQYSKGEGRPAPLYTINQMDSHKLGHISRDYRVTQ